MQWGLLVALRHMNKPRSDIRASEKSEPKPRHTSLRILYFSVDRLAHYEKFTTFTTPAAEKSLHPHLHIPVTSLRALLALLHARASCSAPIYLWSIFPPDVPTPQQPPLQFYLWVIGSQPWSDISIVTFAPGPVQTNPTVASLEMMQRTGMLGPNVVIHKVRRGSLLPSYSDSAACVHLGLRNQRHWFG